MNLNFVMPVSIIGIMSIPAILILYYGTSWSYLKKGGTVKFFSIEYNRKANLCSFSSTICIISEFSYYRFSLRKLYYRSFLWRWNNGDRVVQRKHFSSAWLSQNVMWFVYKFNTTSFINTKSCYEIFSFLKMYRWKAFLLHNIISRFTFFPRKSIPPNSLHLFRNRLKTRFEPRSLCPC